MDGLVFTFFISLVFSEVLIITKDLHALEANMADTCNGSYQVQ